MYGGVSPPASISSRYAGVVPIRFWGATDLTPRYPKVPLMPLVLGLLKESNIPLWYCDVVSLPKPTAETDVILDRGKDIDETVGKFPAARRCCHGLMRAV